MPRWPTRGRPWSWIVAGVAHVTLGNILDEMDRTAEAIPEYDKAIELDPKLANAYNQRSIARSRLGDDSGAAADVDKAIELDPGYGPAYGNRAMSEAFDGDCTKALADADKAITLDPEFRPPTTRALASDAGDLDGALADADKAIALGRSDAFAFWFAA